MESLYRRIYKKKVNIGGKECWVDKKTTVFIYWLLRVPMYLAEFLAEAFFGVLSMLFYNPMEIIVTLMTASLMVYDRIAGSGQLFFTAIMFLVAGSAVMAVERAFDEWGTFCKGYKADLQFTHRAWFNVLAGLQLVYIFGGLTAWVLKLLHEDFMDEAIWLVVGYYTFYLVHALGCVVAGIWHGILNYKEWDPVKSAYFKRQTWQAEGANFTYHPSAEEIRIRQLMSGTEAYPEDCPIFCSEITMEELKRRRRVILKKVHPDAGGDAELVRWVNDQYGKCCKRA